MEAKYETKKVGQWKRKCDYEPEQARGGGVGGGR